MTDSAGTPVAGALVELYGSYERMAGQGTDSAGLFRFARRVANAALLVRAIGFAPVRRALGASDSVVTVALRPLPIEMTELRVSGAPAWCPPQDDPRAREAWARAAAHYDIALSAGLIRSWTLVFAADVPPDSLGLMDTTRLHRVFMGDEGNTPRSGWRALLGPGGPFLESLQAWQFGDRTFAQSNRLAFPPGATGDTVIAFCTALEDLAFIRGAMTLAPDTTFATATWEFARPGQSAGAGGRVLFARVDPTVAAQPLLAMAGFYWRNSGRAYFQQWMEFREWTRCESFASCRTPVRLADRSIAVLTFAAVGDTGAAYLADGLSDGVSRALGEVGRIKVVPRRDVLRTDTAPELPPPRLGQALGAANLVAGTLQRTGDRVRVTVELVHASSGDRLALLSFDTTATGLLGLETQVAAGVAGRVVGQLLPGERMLLARHPTTDASAYDHYLRGNRLLEAPATGAARAIGEYRAALTRDSAFVSARSHLALAYARAAEVAHERTGAVPESLLVAGLETVNATLEDDSADASAWLAGGWLMSLRGTPQDLELAPEALRRAIALDPGDRTARDQYAAALLKMGRFDEAEQEYDRVLALDPHDVDAMAGLGYVAATRRSYGTELRWFERLDSVDATRPDVHLLGALARMATGDTDGAVAEARAAFTVLPPAERLPAVAVMAEAVSHLGGGAAEDSLYRRAVRAVADSLFRRAVRGLAGPTGSLPAVLDVRYAWPVAHAAVALGYYGLALDILERARPQGPLLWGYLILEGFDPLRLDARFVKILDRVRPPGAQDPS